MSSECGVQTNAYLPAFEADRDRLRPDELDPGDASSRHPGRCMKKLCSSERSLTAIE